MKRRGRDWVSRKEVEGTSTFALRSRLSRASSSRNYEEEELVRVQVSEPEMVDVSEVEEEANLVRQWNWGTDCLAYQYQKLNEASNWRTQQLTGSVTLLTG
ncbi:unnamed protein product [Vicia faba]|uniref:Uncharacterized protein n=1 Tax=Vicia faba TaxID=3906 RepID=A0AAV1B1N2_VICFA|nr:unnamed protein product [Vicia faba]